MLSALTFLQKKEQIRRAFEGRFTYSKMAIMYLVCFLQQPSPLLLEFKNRYERASRCFIVGTGPSLRIEDLERLKGEVTFSMNSCIRLFSQTTWRPDFYLCFDPQVYLLLKDEILQADLNTIFYNSFSIPTFCRDAIPCIVNSACITYADSKIAQKKPRAMRFSDDAGKVIYEGHSTVYAAIQLAAYMGFKNIYLIGCDCNYNKEDSHTNGADYGMNTPLSAGERMIKDYADVKNHFKGSKTKIYNATRGGMLESLERVDLDTILSE